QFRHAVGEIARGLVAEGEDAAFDQPQDFFGLVAEIHDVPAILDVDAVAELLLQAVADEFDRLAEAGGRRAVAAHADGDGVGHACLPFALNALPPGLTGGSVNFQRTFSRRIAGSSPAMTALITSYSWQANG